MKTAANAKIDKAIITKATVSPVFFLAILTSFKIESSFNFIIISHIILLFIKTINNVLMVNKKVYKGMIINNNMRTDFSLKECEILIGLCSFDLGNPNSLTLTKTAKAINVSVSNPRLWIVFKALKEGKIIKEREKIGSCKIIEIDKDKLEELIYQQKLLIPIFKFFEDNHDIII